MPLRLTARRVAATAGLALVVTTVVALPRIADNADEAEGSTVGMATSVGPAATSPDPSPPASAPSDSSDWREAATEALEVWDDFPVEADPRPVVVLYDAQGPSGFRTSEQKIALATGNWATPESLPQTPTQVPRHGLRPHDDGDTGRADRQPRAARRLVTRRGPRPAPGGARGLSLRGRGRRKRFRGSVSAE